jgi:hypothetical protein
LETCKSNKGKKDEHLYLYGLSQPLRSFVENLIICNHSLYDYL